MVATASDGILLAIATLLAIASFLKILRRRRTLQHLSKSIMLFDGDCVMCNGYVDFCIAREPNKKLKVAALDSATGRLLLRFHGVPQPPSSFVVIETVGAASHVYLKSDAALHSLSALSPTCLWILVILLEAVPRALRDPVYDLGWRYRRRLFGTTACRKRDADRAVIPPWPPLASSPTALTKLATLLGWDTSRSAFVDVLGLDAELLALLPPCHAMLLTYPTVAAAEGFLDAYAKAAGADDCFHLRQLNGGSCGTIAVLHALLNCPGELEAMSNDLRRNLFGDGEEEEVVPSLQLVESPLIRDAHLQCVSASSAATAEAGVRQGRHYLTFVRRRVNGTESLLVLDGRRDAPINCGETSSGEFTRDCAVLVSEMAKEVGRLDQAAALSFSLVALVDV